MRALKTFHEYRSGPLKAVRATVVTAHASHCSFPGILRASHFEGPILVPRTSGGAHARVLSLSQGGAIGAGKGGARHSQRERETRRLMMAAGAAPVAVLTAGDKKCREAPRRDGSGGRVNKGRIASTGGALILCAPPAGMMPACQLRYFKNELRRWRAAKHVALRRGITCPPPSLRSLSPSSPCFLDCGLPEGTIPVAPLICVSTDRGADQQWPRWRVTAISRERERLRKGGMDHGEGAAAQGQPGGTKPTAS